jgi:hypothetical protein
MRDYQSKVLKRTFDSVYFVGSIRTATGKSSAASGIQAPHPTANSDPHVGIKANTGALPPEVTDFSGIKKAEGGLTVAEVFSQKDKLANNKVTLRGKVVKYNSQILGRNWAHIRDGTGVAPANDLLVTTASAARVGDTILVTGTLALNKDFGYGYKYDLLVEDAKVTVESKTKP